MRMTIIVQKPNRVDFNKAIGDILIDCPLEEHAQMGIENLDLGP